MLPLLQPAESGSDGLARSGTHTPWLQEECRSAAVACPSRRQHYAAHRDEDRPDTHRREAPAPVAYRAPAAGDDVVRHRRHWISRAKTVMAALRGTQPFVLRTWNLELRTSDFERR